MVNRAHEFDRYIGRRAWQPFNTRLRHKYRPMPA
jgi:hypothetical protein